MRVFKFDEAGRVIECGPEESFFTAWISSVPGDWEKFCLSKPPPGSAEFREALRDAFVAAHGDK